MSAERSGRPPSGCRKCSFAYKLDLTHVLLSQVFLEEEGRTWKIGEGESLGGSEDRGQEAGRASSSGTLEIKQREMERRGGRLTVGSMCVPCPTGVALYLARVHLKLPGVFRNVFWGRRNTHKHLEIHSCGTPLNSEIDHCPYWRGCRLGGGSASRPSLSLTTTGCDH